MSVLRFKIPENKFGILVKENCTGIELIKYFDSLIKNTEERDIRNVLCNELIRCVTDGVVRISANRKSAELEHQAKTDVTYGLRNKLYSIPHDKLLQEIATYLGMYTGECIYYPGGADHNGICCFCISDKLAGGEITDEQARLAIEGMSRAARSIALPYAERHTDAYIRLYELIKDIL